MKELMDKAAVVAAIEKLKRQLLRGACSSQISMETNCKEEAYDEVLSFLNTLELKKVDLEKELKDYFNNQPIITRSKGIDYQLIPTGVDIAKYFFELGLKAQKEE